MPERKLAECQSDVVVALSSPNGRGIEKTDDIPLLPLVEIGSTSLWGGVWSPENWGDTSFESEEETQSAYGEEKEWCEAHGVFVL